jgi:hypothetical protein
MKEYYYVCRNQQCSGFDVKKTIYQVKKNTCPHCGETVKEFSREAERHFTRGFERGYRERLDKINYKTIVEEHDKDYLRINEMKWRNSGNSLILGEVVERDKREKGCQNILSFMESTCRNAKGFKEIRDDWSAYYGATIAKEEESRKEQRTGYRRDAARSEYKLAKCLYDKKYYEVRHAQELTVVGNMMSRDRVDGIPLTYDEYLEKYDIETMVNEGLIEKQKEMKHDTSLLRLQKPKVRTDKETRALMEYNQRKVQ